MGHFEDRRLTQVVVYGMNFIEGDESDQHGSGFGLTVDLGISSIDGGDLGPVASVDLFVPAERDASLSSIEDQAVDRALDVLSRIVREDRQDVKRVLLQPPAVDVMKR